MFDANVRDARRSPLRRAVRVLLAASLATALFAPACLARGIAPGLRFGISNHNSWAARWLQPAYGYDGEGPLEGVRYDAYTLTKVDGKGKWWEGLDPQDPARHGA